MGGRGGGLGQFFPKKVLPRSGTRCYLPCKRWLIASALCRGERSCFSQSSLSIPVPGWQNVGGHKYCRMGVALSFEEKHWSNSAYLYWWFIIPFYSLTGGLMIEVKFCTTIGEINIYATWLFYYTNRIFSLQCNTEFKIALNKKFQISPRVLTEEGLFY